MYFTQSGGEFLAGGENIDVAVNVLICVKFTLVNRLLIIYKNLSISRLQRL